MKNSPCDIAERIKAEASRLGFDACGFAQAGPVSAQAVERYSQWIAQGKHGCMAWAARYPELRSDPTQLLPGARTVICLAMNYYPSRFKPQGTPQIAYYAYGRDYHEVARDRARQLAQYIKENTGCESRVCVDSAPMRERYWSQLAGIGFVGINGMLILPGKGSYYFLCEVVTTLSVPPSEPCTLSCAGCHACERECPSGALKGGVVDARRCISCLTIENHDPELPEWLAGVIGDRVYGCDACQQCCPHNRGAVACTTPEFQPSDELLRLTLDDILNMSQADFSRIFSHSAVKRTKLAGLQRNAALLKRHPR